MHPLVSEFEQAREELSFWRDFSLRWKHNHRDTEEPRMREILELAEDRYAQAEKLYRLPGPGARPTLFD
jgi:hypothetical protein